MINIESFCNIFDINKLKGMWQSQYVLNGPWVSHNRELTNLDIQNHLAGQLWLSTKPRGVTPANVGTGASSRWLIVDIDDHGENSSRYGPVTSRVETVLRLLNRCTPIIFSSPTGEGKHIYFKCEKEISIKNLLHPLVNLCIQKNVMLAKNGIELLPYPTVFVRLPLGKMQRLERMGSFQYHEPITGAEALLEIQSMWDKILPLRPKELVVNE